MFSGFGFHKQPLFNNLFTPFQCWIGESRSIETGDTTGCSMLRNRGDLAFVRPPIYNAMLTRRQNGTTCIAMLQNFGGIAANVGLPLHGSV